LIIYRIVFMVAGISGLGVSRGRVRRLIVSARIAGLVVAISVGGGSSDDSQDNQSDLLNFHILIQVNFNLDLMVLVEFNYFTFMFYSLLFAVLVR